MTIREFQFMCGNMEYNTPIRIWDPERNMKIADCPYHALPEEFKNLKIKNFDFDLDFAACFVVISPA